MTRDLLREATTALSQSGHKQSGGKFTRERIVATLHDNQRRGRARRALLLPMAAIFVGSTAFASVNGSLSRVFQSALVFVGIEASAPVTVDPGEPTGTPSRSAAAGHGQQVEVHEPKPPEPPEPAPPKATGVAVEPPRAVSGVPGTAAAEPQAPPRIADGQELYRRGHYAQFKDGNPAKALEAYDAYLQQQPHGRFAVDARYNRALCLVRLGRHDEAQKSLAPFANGDFGDYRKKDAQRLLDALRR